MWAQIATTLTGKKKSRRKWSLAEMTAEREKNDLLWFLYFPLMTDGKRHLLYDILQTSKNDYYKEWQSFRKHDGAWRNNLSKIHLLNLYAWMESNFLFFFQTPYWDLAQHRLLLLYGSWVPTLVLSMSYTSTEKQSPHKVTTPARLSLLQDEEPGD